VGLVISFFALGFLLLAAVYALSIVMAAWLAALFVGATLAMASIALISSGVRKLKRINVVLEKTADSLKENMQWARNQIR
jgi:Kef-type K+ transport system membrane component KefB